MARRAQRRRAAHEAADSSAAQPMYAQGPTYASPEQERLTSDVKDFLGICDALGGYIHCPNQAP